MEKPKAPSLWQRAVYRWAAVLTVMSALLLLYTRHPYYLNNMFAPFRPFYIAAYALWLSLGIFYVRATLLKFKGRRYDMRDGGLHLLIMGKALWYDRPKFWRLLKNKRIKTTVLAICVKGFFTPLMTSFLSGHAQSIVNAWAHKKGRAPVQLVLQAGNPLEQASAWWMQVKQRVPELLPVASDFSGLFHPGTWTLADTNWGLGFVYDIIFFVDCGWALMGYSSESKWLNNKTRSVEPTGFGWIVCIFCYPPYNNILGTYLPLQNGPAIITDPVWLLVLRAVTVGAFAIYASATVAFGFRFSNLTNRGIVSRGPYRFVRHPAYLTKCFAWWMEHLPTLNPVKAFFLACLCGVYALRAWTEERHLGQDPDYRAYKKKVPWVFIPGVY
ncbi:MAG: DUF1295 domain-containing protein [Myxococcales bacterium]|nr:DUF1295 domain-containing protein [Myxococcales bacterium]